MIYTVTLNSALDRMLWVEKITLDDSNRIEREKRFAAGKGVDVSRVLTTLGVRNTALGFVGGFTGEELEGRLLNKGVTCDFVKISGETRTNIVINDMSTGKQILFSGKGPKIKPFELMRLIHKIENITENDMSIISGSLPPGINPEVTYKIIEMAKKRGAKVLLDADDEILTIGIQAKPDIIKPNIHELSRLVNQKLTTMDDIMAAAKNLNNQGVKIILTSLGARGIVLVSKNEYYHAVPPQVEVKNTIGAGDSAVAGFVYGQINGKNLKESLTYAVAAGTATTMQSGTALCKKDDFKRLISEVKITELPKT
jgi:6-phosphofructokinase 2